MWRLRAAVACVTVLVAVATFGVVNRSHADAPPDVVQGIKDDIPYVRVVLASEPQHFGLTKLSDADNVTFGEGFRVHYVSEQGVIDASTDVDDIIKPYPSLHIFPIYVNANPVGTAWAQRVGDEWKIIQVSSDSRFANDVREAQRMLVANGITGQLRLVYDEGHRIVGLVGVDSRGNSRFAPMRDISMYNLPSSQVVDMERLVSEVRQRIQSSSDKGAVGGPTGVSSESEHAMPNPVWAGFGAGALAVIVGSLWWVRRRVR